MPTPWPTLVIVFTEYFISHTQIKKELTNVSWCWHITVSNSFFILYNKVTSPIIMTATSVTLLIQIHPMFQWWHFGRHDGPMRQKRPSPSLITGIQSQGPTDWEKRTNSRKLSYDWPQHVWTHMHQAHKYKLAQIRTSWSSNTGSTQISDHTMEFVTWSIKLSFIRHVHSLVPSQSHLHLSR